MKISQKTTLEFELKLNARDILKLLQTDDGACFVGDHAPPDTAVVSFDVPSGGDYSGMTLDVGELYPITITWTEKSHE